MIYAMPRHVQVGTKKSRLCPRLQPGLGCKFPSFLSGSLQVPAVSLCPAPPKKSPLGEVLVREALVGCWYQLSDPST